VFNLPKEDKKLFLALLSSMGVVIILSNYLVQFPVNKFNLQDILTYGAFSYPITFLITDLSNRRFGKVFAKKIVYFGFILGILLTFLISTNFDDVISIRIAIGSGSAFIIAQLLDIEIFQKLRNRSWYIAPIVSSIFGSVVDTFLFFSIAFYGTALPWFTLALGDLMVKLLIAILMLIPFRILLSKIRDLNHNQNQLA